MPSSHRDVITNVLVSYCISTTEMKVSDVASRLNDKGMKAMVIKDEVEFQYHNGEESMKWARWDCGEFGIYTLVSIRYRDVNDRTVKCSDKGSMPDSHRNIVTKVLQGYCQSTNKMKLSDVTSLLNDTGMKAMLIKGHATLSYHSGQEVMKWARWDCGKFGQYTVVSIRYRDVNDRTVKCSDKGSMPDSHRNVITKVLQSYCQSTTKMKLSDVTSQLNEKGMKAIAIKGDVWFSYRSGQEAMEWAIWDCGKFGQYTMVSIRYRDVNDNSVSCYAQGNMSDVSRAVISNVLSNYCQTSIKKTMSSKDVTIELNKEGMKSIVMGGDVDFNFFQGIQKMKWSKWECGKFGKCIIMSIQHRPNNSNVNCKYNENMSDNHIWLISDTLKQCAKQKKMSSEYIANILKQNGMTSVVTDNAVSVSHNSDVNAMHKLCYSQWDCGKYGIYTVVNVSDRQHINQWTCVELKEWIRGLNLSHKYEKQVIEAITPNVSGKDFNLIQRPIDIRDSLKIDEMCAMKIFSSLETLRAKSSHGNYR
eukprot:173971_1